MGTFSIIILFSVSLLCLIAFIRISSIVPNNEPSAVHQQFDGEMPDSHRRLAESKSTVENPFMDGVCLDFIQDSMLQVTVNSVSVVVVARNEDRSALLRTIKSVIDHSMYEGSTVGVSHQIILKSIVVVDDFSYSPISTWDEWAALKAERPAAASLLKIVRLTRHSGTAFAKNRGAEEAKKALTTTDTAAASGDAAEHALVFLDAHSLVSPYWLVPLASTLSRYPKALVYPVLDVLTTSTNDAGVDEVGVIPAEAHLVAGFDWALRPRWESLLTRRQKEQHERPVRDRVKVPAHATEVGAVEVLSPAAPGIFAVRERFFEEMGRFDSAQSGSYASPSEAVEHSLRVWLCGGMVLKQSCSRVAHRSTNLFSDAPVGHGVTQGAVDKAVLNVAQKWMQGAAVLPESYKGESVSYQELTFRARFLGRVPYGVEVANDPIAVTPPQSTLYTLHPGAVKVNPGGDGTLSSLHVCLSFQWYLDEVYPGLVADAPGVLERFAAYLSSDYLQQQKPFQAQLQEYNKPADQQKTHVMQTGLLSVRAGKLEKLAATAIGAGTPVQGGNDAFKVKRVFPTPPGPKTLTRSELLAAHHSQVEQNLLCADFPEKSYADSCAARLASDPEMCTARKGDILFQCPQTCKFCAQEDGLFCEDFYLNKCVKWAAEGKCGQRDAEFGVINDACRKSCKVCTPLYMVNGGSGGSVAAAEVAPVVAPAAPAAPAAARVAGRGAVSRPEVPVGDGRKHIELKVRKDALPVQPEHRLQQSTDPNLPPPPQLPEYSEKEIEMLRVDLMINKPMTVDPEYLQKQYRAGQVPDYVDGAGTVVAENNQCEPMDRGDAQLLSRIHVASSEERNLNVDADGKPLRIFCAIYTMESNHDTNVKATRNTWAKRCDGFIAFSTKDDPTIPAVAIMHEGKEAYDNMWQKSRSIWKYVHAHLRDQYDFFLLGGDDMFYIVENLRAYLGSEEITTLRKEREGLFLGRIFQPPNQIVFNSGGAGYMLDVKALTALGKNIDSPKCFPHQVGFWEDVNVANCLKKGSPSIVPYDTRDFLQRERFHPFTPGLQLSYRIPPKNPDWYAKYNPELKVGFDCCSDSSISFHYVKEKLLYKLYNYVYHCDHKLEQQ